MVAVSRVVRHEKKWDPRLLCIAATILAAFVLSALVLCGSASAADRGLEKYEGLDGKAGVQSIAAAEDGSLQERPIISTSRTTLAITTGGLGLCDRLEALRADPTGFPPRTLRSWSSFSARI